MGVILVEVEINVPFMENITEEEKVQVGDEKPTS